MNGIIDQKVFAFRSKLEELAKDVHHLTVMIGHEELAETISNLRNRINEPFMFVIVGEVKAGKSSFINALLDVGKEVAMVAPQPMTDTIQQIVYGEKEEIITINPFLKKITQPVDILKEIAIVDTPGTNTIVEKHQEITEGFIPGSDLIVFVFESKNPYRQSAWDFLNFIHSDWQKKVIFILQQKDLMEPADLLINMEGVRKQAESKGMNQPIVFAVSAKMELDGNKEVSGFREVREYIAANITGGRAPYLKLENVLTTLVNIQHRIGHG
ncbi:MAG TPA: dynamin family protein, partial [Saprospiraceae bacterium]|nr:dynamin family protein [Saprospiraceae bacterium]